MIPDELLSDDQRRHRDDLADAIGVGRRVQRIRAHVLDRLGPAAAARQQLIDDLPPDSRPGPIIVVQAARP